MDQQISEREQRRLRRNVIREEQQNRIDRYRDNALQDELRQTRQRQYQDRDTDVRNGQQQGIHTYTNDIGNEHRNEYRQRKSVDTESLLKHFSDMESVFGSEGATNIPTVDKESERRKQRWQDMKNDNMQEYYYDPVDQDIDFEKNENYLSTGGKDSKSSSHLHRESVKNKKSVSFEKVEPADSRGTTPNSDESYLDFSKELRKLDQKLESIREHNIDLGHTQNIISSTRIQTPLDYDQTKRKELPSRLKVSESVDYDDGMRSDFEREHLLIQNLREQNSHIELERKRNEEEESEVLKRIHNMKVTEYEFNKKRQERERLERELDKKRELERIRLERLSLLKNQEQVLAQRLNNMDRDFYYDRIGIGSEELPYYNIRQNDGNRNTDNIEFRELEGDTVPNIPHVRENFVDRIQSGFGKPKIPSFDGTDFKVWKVEVECIMKSGIYPESLISQTMRNSLKGQTRKILLTIDPMANSYDILKKLDDIYGTTQTEDSIMQDLFNSKQEDSESSSDWALRLEAIMQLAIESGEISEIKKNSLLKQRFWKGLRSEKLRNNTRVTFESSANFEQLRRKTRVEEEELKRSTNEQKVMKIPEMTNMKNEKDTTNQQENETRVQLQQMKTTSPLDKQMLMMQQLMNKMNKLEKELELLRQENKEKEKKDTDYTTPYRSEQYSYRRGYSRGRRPFQYSFYGQPRQYNYRGYNGRQTPQTEVTETKPKENTGNDTCTKKSNTPKDENLNA